MFFIISYISFPIEHLNLMKYSISLSLHLVYKGFINQRIGITCIECYAWTQKRLQIVGKLRIIHFLLHIIDKLLVRWSPINHKLHILLVALKDFINIHILSSRNDRSSTRLRQ